MTVQETEESIVLRQWTDTDVEPYARMNSDPEVMRYFPAPLTLEQSRESMRKIRAAIDERGWGLWRGSASREIRTKISSIL